MKCKYCGMYLENVDEESTNGMAHTIECQKRKIEKDGIPSSETNENTKKRDEYSLEHQARSYGRGNMAEKEVERLRMLVDESMRLKYRMQRVALAEEDKGVPVSVCDYCEETYPESWILDGICPFCGHAHNEENDCKHKDGTLLFGGHKDINTGIVR